MSKFEQFCSQQSNSPSLLRRIEFIEKSFGIVWATRESAPVSFLFKFSSKIDDKLDNWCYPLIQFILKAGDEIFKEALYWGCRLYRMLKMISFAIWFTSIKITNEQSHFKRTHLMLIMRTADSVCEIILIHIASSSILTFSLSSLKHCYS